MKQRKSAEFVLKFIAQRGGTRVDIWNLAAISLVHRARRNRILRARVHVEPPEHVEAGDGAIALPRGFPEFLTMHQMIGLLPEMNFRQIPIVPPVADDAMLRRR